MSRRVALLLAAAGMVVLMLALASGALAAPGAPTVVSTFPENGAMDVALDADFRAKFSEAMKARSINTNTFFLTADDCGPACNGTTKVPATVRYNAGSRTAVLDPTEPLVANTTYTAVVEGTGDGDRNAVEDRGGTPMATDYIYLYFTTGDAPCAGCEPPGGDVAGADWQMNEISGQMLDSSGNNNIGTPVDVLQTGSRYGFNGSTSYVAVPDSDSLDPEGKHITLSAGVTVTDKPMDDDSYDIVRKGLSHTPGGDYKMEIKRAADPSVGRLHCLFKGDGGTVDIVARRDIVDGEFHTLECIKTSTSVAARIDGEIGGTTAGSAGSISNASNVMVGAKTANPLDDVFNGSVDYVSVNIAQ